MHLLSFAGHLPNHTTVKPLHHAIQHHYGNETIMLDSALPERPRFDKSYIANVIVAKPKATSRTPKSFNSP
jgi:hypothetical protein